MSKTQISAVSANQQGSLAGHQANPLAKLGGFSFVESVVDGIANMNGDRKARKQIFLTDANKAIERKDLLKKLNLWIELLESNDSTEKILDSCKTKSLAAADTLKKGLKNALVQTRELETSYRTVAQFYKNTELDKVDNVHIVNASLEQVKDLDNPLFIDHIEAEFKQYYDRLDLRDNYSILAVPGYLGSNKVVEKWAKVCSENKVMLVTDFADLDKADDVVDLFHSANLTGGELHRSNVIMTCNWIVGRGRAKEVGEEDSIFLPPSTSLAGKIHKTLMSQVAAGKKHGSISEVDAVKFNLKKSEIHFRPTIAVNNETADGETVNESFSFNNIGDFTPKSLIKHSEFLNNQNLEQEQYNTIIRQLRNNKVLNSALTNPEAKAEFIEVLRAVASELEKK